MDGSGFTSGRMHSCSRPSKDIERLGLLKHIKTCAGSLNFRLRKPTNGALSKTPSNHAFGIAIDLNSDDGSLGESVAPVAPVFQKLWFVWGKSFADPMHFEVARFINHPRSVASAVKTRLAGAPLAFDTINFGGEVMAPLGQIDAALKLSYSPSVGQRVRGQGRGGSGGDRRRATGWWLGLRATDAIGRTGRASNGLRQRVQDR